MYDTHEINTSIIRTEYDPEYDNETLDLSDDLDQSNELDSTIDEQNQYYRDIQGLPDLMSDELVSDEVFWARVNFRRYCETGRDYHSLGEYQQQSVDHLNDYPDYM